MGMIGNQPPRWDGLDESDLMATIEHYKEVAKKTGLTLEQVLRVNKINLQRLAIMVAVQDGDYRDEHAAGYEDCLDEIAQALQSVACSLDSVAMAITDAAEEEAEAAGK